MQKPIRVHRTNIRVHQVVLIREKDLAGRKYKILWIN